MKGAWTSSIALVLLQKNRMEILAAPLVDSGRSLDSICCSFFCSCRTHVFINQSLEEREDPEVTDTFIHTIIYLQRPVRGNSL